MSFELDTRGADALEQLAYDQGVPLGEGMPPALLDNMGSATVKGVARGLLGKPALVFGDAVWQPLRPTARALDARLGTSLDKWLADEQERNRRALTEWSVDPRTTGLAGQLLHGIADLGSSAVLYTPEGAAMLEGYAQREDLLRKGVDENTATLGGVISGATTYVGVKAPVTIGRSSVGQGAAQVARNVGYGATVSVGSGVAQRGGMHDLLERAGYPQQAALYQPFDETALASEAVLGGLFSGGAAALEMRATTRGQAAVDAALATRQAKHAAVDTAPGVPADPRSAGAHSTALGKAMGQVLQNQPVDVGDALGNTTFVRGDATAGREAREELRLHVADLLPEGVGPTFTPAADAPRGIRGNNPGNIEVTGERWQGQTGSDGRFATFDTPQAGIRALARNLLTYQERHGLNTVQAIVNRWAPPRENDTGAYVQAVARALGVEPDATLSLRDPQTLQRLAEAIIHHENGRQPYPEAVVRAGVDAALGRVPLADAGAGRAMGAERMPGAREPGLAHADGEPARAVGEPAAGRDEAASAGRVGAGLIDQAQAAPGALEAATQPAAARSAAPGAASRLPRASELEPVAVGPGMVQPREIATGQPLYRETSVEGLSDLLMDDQRAHVRQMFVADNRDLAIGQGENRGVQVVFREGSLSGAEHRKPGTGDRAGREYRTDLVAPRAIESFTVPAGFRPTGLRGLARRALADFDAAPQPDGSTVYTRKAAAEPTSAPVDVGAEAGRGQPAQAAGNDAAGPGSTAAPPTAAEARAAGAEATVGSTVRAAEQALAVHPDLRVVLEDGTELSARDLLARMADDQQRAQQDAKAFDAAVNCFLTT